MRIAVILAGSLAAVAAAAMADDFGAASATDGVRLAYLPGAGSVGQALPAQPAEEGPAFKKFYLRRIPRELVWFNGREGDLEKHAITRKGYIYITLTDLVWGPRDSFVEVRRDNRTVRVFPGTAKVLVNSEVESVGAPTFRVAGRLWVPVRPFAELFGATAEWNAGLRRLEVAF